jgi:hypothetical protein
LATRTGDSCWLPSRHDVALETVYLPALVCGNVTNVRDKEQLLRILSPSWRSTLVKRDLSTACGGCLADCHGDRVGGGSDGGGSATLNVDSVRTVKFLGSSVASSTLLEGYVAVRGLETVCTSAADAKICIFAGLEVPPKPRARFS